MQTATTCAYKYLSLRYEVDRISWYVLWNDKFTVYHSSGFTARLLLLPHCQFNKANNQVVLSWISTRQ